MKRRRTPSSGSIFKRSDGVWIAALRYRGKLHQRRAQSKSLAREKLGDLYGISQNTADKRFSCLRVNLGNDIKGVKRHE